MCLVWKQWDRGNGKVWVGRAEAALERRLRKNKPGEEGLVWVRAQQLFVPRLQILALRCWWLWEVWSAVYAFYWVRVETKYNREPHQGAERKTLLHPIVCLLGDSLSSSCLHFLATSLLSILNSCRWLTPLEESQSFWCIVSPVLRKNNLTGNVFNLMCVK